MWIEVKKTDKRAVSLADRHYSRGKVGSREIGPPGQKIVLITENERAVWGSHRPAPWANIKRMDGFEGHSCFIFRNEDCGFLSSALIREAIGLTVEKWGVAPFLTYVAVTKVESPNPGYCFLKAGFEGIAFREKTKHGLMRKLVMPSEEVLHCWGEYNGYL